MFVVGLVLFGVAMAAYGLLFAVWLGQRWAPKNAEPSLFGDSEALLRASTNVVRDNVVTTSSVDGR